MRLRHLSVDQREVETTRSSQIGPVFRAENSNTPRHLCEFTGMGLEKCQGCLWQRVARGLDFEMPIMWHYNEVIQAK